MNPGSAEGILVCLDLDRERLGCIREREKLCVGGLEEEEWKGRIQRGHCQSG